ncbi:c-type cytochrome [Vibrio cionasavignyae]|uniref:c-type cytochrome n=1 Tax=Vibrio cionasavignyae TaxID=2910252 RepID=UPI003D0E453E
MITLMKSNLKMFAGGCVPQLVTRLFVIALVVQSSAIKADEIEQRQQAFNQIESLTESVQKTLNGNETTWADVEDTSIKLVAYSDMLNQAFPENSHQGSRAKLDVWQKPEKFNRLMLEMNNSYKTLLTAANNQDEKQAKQAIKSAESTCRACHRTYRSRW